MVEGGSVNNTAHFGAFGTPCDNLRTLKPDFGVLSCVCVFVTQISILDTGNSNSQVPLYNPGQSWKCHGGSVASFVSRDNS